MNASDTYGPKPQQIILVGLAFGLIAWLSSVCYGQRMLSRGSAAQSNMAFEEIASWNEAKKLSPFPIPQGMQPPFPQGQDPLTVPKGATVDLVYWNFRVLDVLDSKNCLLQLGRDTTIWLENYPTEGLVDELKVRLVGPLRCNGEKSYPTQTGLRRVKAFSFPTKEEIEAEQARLKKLEQDAEEAKWRVWKSTAGTEVEAKFVSYQFNVGVTLLKRDGTKIVVPIAKFSESDQQIIRLEAKAQREAKKK